MYKYFYDSVFGPLREITRIEFIELTKDPMSKGKMYVCKLHCKNKKITCSFNRKSLCKHCPCRSQLNV